MISQLQLWPLSVQIVPTQLLSYRTELRQQWPTWMFCQDFQTSYKIKSIISSNKLLYLSELLAECLAKSITADTKCSVNMWWTNEWLCYLYYCDFIRGLFTVHSSFSWPSRLCLYSICIVLKLVFLPFPCTYPILTFCFFSCLFGFVHLSTAALLPIIAWQLPCMLQVNLYYTLS